MKIGKHKISAIVLLMVFFSQQVSWACGYNLSLLVNPPPSLLIYQDHGEFNRFVAKRVYSIVKPSFRHNIKELKSAYQWLKSPATQTVPCSAYVLYNLLLAKGIEPKIEDISASLISFDLKAGNLKPPFSESRINNSLYAMAKTSGSLGLKLLPSRIDSITPELLNSLDSQTPFIAHLNSLVEGHFVLVTKIDQEKVYFFYDKGNTFLPLEKFLEDFSGYALLLPPAGTAQCAVATVSDSEAQSVLGAGRSYHGRSVNISSLFKKPSTMESVIGIGMAFGGAFTMGGSGYGSLAAIGVKVGGSYLFKDSKWGQIGTSIVAGAVGGGINGGMSGGWKEALQGAGVGAAKSAAISGTMYGISQIKVNGLSPSVMASIGQLVAVPLGNAVGRGLEVGLDLPMYDGRGNRLTGDSLTKAHEGGFGTGFWQGLTFQTPESWEGGKESFLQKWGPALQHYGSETAGIAIETFAPSKYSSAYGMGISSMFSLFTKNNDSWGKAVGIAIGKGVAMGGASVLLANLTKDMRVTEGAFLEKAASSIAGAGVEAIFGYNKAEAVGLAPASRWGIFSKSLVNNWVDTSKSIVTFGNPSGNFLNYQGGYAIAKMHTFGSDIAALKKGGLKSSDAVRYAWNQYVGSSLHYSAINDFSSIAENRIRGVSYVNSGSKVLKVEPYTDDLVKSFGKSAKLWRDPETGKLLPKQSLSKIDTATGLRQETTFNEQAGVSLINRYDENNQQVFSLDLDNQVVYGQGYAYDKVKGKEYVYDYGNNSKEMIERLGGRKTGTALKYDYKNRKIIEGTVSSTINIVSDDKPVFLTQKITVTDKGRIIERFDEAGNKVFSLDLIDKNVMSKVGKVKDRTIEARKVSDSLIATEVSDKDGFKTRVMESYETFEYAPARKKQELRSSYAGSKELSSSQTDFTYNGDGSLSSSKEYAKFFNSNTGNIEGEYTTKFTYEADGSRSAQRYDSNNNPISNWEKDENGKLAYEGLIDNEGRIVESSSNDLNKVGEKAITENKSVFSQQNQEQEALKEAFFPHRKARIGVGMVENVALSQDANNLNKVDDKTVEVPEIKERIIGGRGGPRKVYEVNGNEFNNHESAQEYAANASTQLSLPKGEVIVTTSIPLTTVTPTPTISPTLIPAPSPEPSPTGTLQATASPIGSPTPISTPAVSFTPFASPTPNTTPTPQASPTPTEDYFSDVFYNLETKGNITTFTNQNTGKIDRVVTKYDDGTFEVDDKANNERYKVIGLSSNEEWTLAKAQVEKAGGDWGRIYNKLVNNNLASPNNRDKISLRGRIWIEKKDIISEVFGNDSPGILSILEQATDHKKEILWETREMIGAKGKIYVFQDNRYGRKTEINYGDSNENDAKKVEVNIAVYDQDGKEVGRINNFSLLDILKIDNETKNIPGNHTSNFVYAEQYFVNAMQKKIKDASRHSLMAAAVENFMEGKEILTALEISSRR